jgi:predicted permease
MRLTRFLRRKHWDAERTRELEAYLAEEIADNIARGMTPGQASTAAHRKLGNTTRIREEIYTMNSLGFVDTLWQDVRYGLRLLRRDPAFTVLAVLMLALGIGANTAMFQLVDAVRLRTLPVADAGNLVEIRVETHGTGPTGRFISDRPLMTEPLLRQIVERQQAFSSVLAYAGTTFDMAGGGESRPVQGIWVNGDYFHTLGVKAQLGRVIGPHDDRPGCGTPGVVLSNSFWRRQFGADPAIAGRTLALDGRPFEIIGVTPPSFFGVEVGRSFDVAVPLCAEPALRGDRSAIGKPDYWFLDLIGRLQSGWTEERASAHLAALSPDIFRVTTPPRYAASEARNYQGFTLTIRPAATGVSSLRGDYEMPLSALLGATGLILLISCANLANLLLGRANVRRRELAARLAIGASRGRIVRQMLVESALLATISALAALVIAVWLSQFLVAFLDTRGNRVFVDLRTDWRTVGFVAAVSAVTTLVFGLIPSLRATRVPIAEVMRSGGRGYTGTHQRHGLGRTLVGVQVALSFVLIAGALLLGRTFSNLTTMDPGFRHEGVMVVTVDVRRAGPPETRPALGARIAEALAAIPRVEGVAQTVVVPVSGNWWNNRIVVNGAEQPGTVDMSSVGDRYFDVLGTRVVAGRRFDPRLDHAGSEPVAIVTKAFAAKFYPSGDAVGRIFQVATPDSPSYRIVGIVEDAKYSQLRDPYGPTAYFPLSQMPDQRPGPNFLVRSSLPDAELTAAATAAIGQIHPSMLVTYRTLSAQIADSLVAERLMATLSAGFGILAMLIATIGLYGVMSYLVTQRRKEIGVRMALGADRLNVVRMVMRQALPTCAAGLAVGLVLVVPAARAGEALLYGLSATDLPTLAMAVGAVGFVCILASWIPARRASRLAPTVALREE